MTDPYTAGSGIFGALLEAHPGPLSRAEIATMLGDRLAPSRWVEGELVFASRAAVRADQLSI